MPHYIFFSAHLQRLVGKCIRDHSLLNIFTSNSLNNAVFTAIGGVSSGQLLRCQGKQRKRTPPLVDCPKKWT